MKNYFSMSVEKVLEKFNVGRDGLNDSEVKSQREKYGYNELAEGTKKSVFQVFIEQFKDLLVIILLAAAVISALSGNLESTIVIFAVIILNAILGTVQHVKAEQSLNSLKALSSPNAKVIRNSTKIEIPSKDVVPGDILVLEAGDFVPADGRILENYSLQVNESSLTGESESVIKFSEIIDQDELALGDQKNMVFSGSLVTYGRAYVVATGTGMSTEIGKIATLLESTQEKKTPLQVSLDDFSKKLAIGILGVCAIVFALSMYRQIPILDSLMFAVALAVAAIPEALGSIVTIVLAIGTQKMATENAIIKQLKAVEGLGCVSVICSDKTGTLTQNKMKVKKSFVDNKVIDFEDYDLNNDLQKKLMRCSILCNDSIIDNGTEIGDPTETALVDLGKNYQIDELELRDIYPRLSEIPFDSDRKLMSTSHEMYGKCIMFTKGALDVLLPRIKYIETSDGIKEFTDEDRTNIEEMNQNFSENGLRVLAFAYKEIPENYVLSLNDEDNYTFLGLISMIDPPREESAKAVSDCIGAGIKPVMITGDHKITASAIATQIGILKPGDEALNGVDLDKLSDEELKEKVDKVSVYARVSPEHKIRIVKAWQEKGNIVAMTGDGVNDAPALKQADIGIAMGITGTEVSKDAASMILTDDNFATIVKSVANGRNVYTNIKNSIKFLLSGNTAGIFSVLYTSLLALPMPFAPVHLLFINLLTDSLPAIAIGVESPKGDLLKQKPRNSKAPIVSKDFLGEIVFEGILITIFTLIAYHIGLRSGGDAVASTMAFATLCLARLFHGFNCRGDKSLFQIGLFSNKFSWIAFFLGLGLLTLVLTVGPLKELFEVSNLNSAQLESIYLLAFLPTVLIQLSKVILVDRVKK
ncbi:cation-transporting ATPase, P-type [Gottschalkia acidurici 9a]|uniref:P-type Ca(2+) transporter n=1 Tax=Gottschalkia acidurici (strain ATCC 7906 / DSM 604 / BCRC 14475 / CIP 104303 / KCTC 5404 / NCIMB 10678 / 9a) TaxID=1128398 RepID=K0B0G0_GOTA9|nr:cation-translocating P-type ATPase [Gottschalkia acidurici]AFS78136.1 cation-transporting ATPase, P-type [Gottschalkia acidurici 9a]